MPRVVAIRRIPSTASTASVHARNDPRSTSLGAWIPRVSTKARPRAAAATATIAPAPIVASTAAVSPPIAYPTPSVRADTEFAAATSSGASDRDGSNAW